MINFFDLIYCIFQTNNRIINSMKILSSIRLIIAISANLILPLYFILTSKKHKYILQKKDKNDSLIVVSLTSFPARINRVWLMIETVFRQSVKPDKIVLYLSINQFPNYNSLPKRLLKLQKRGLEIYLKEDDLRSHKKYFYALQDFPYSSIITLDDDIYYNTNIVKDLITLHLKYPNSIICNRAWKIETENNVILPYKKWSLLMKETTPRTDIFPTGVGGVLYPPKTLHQEVLNVKIFKEIVLCADDIWLNAMAYINNSKYVKTSNDNILFLPIIYLYNQKLTNINVVNNQNDIQFSAVRNYCIEFFNKDPYQNVIEK